MFKFSFREILIVILLAILFGGASLMGLDPNLTVDTSSLLKLRHLTNGITLLILVIMSGFNIWYFPTKPLPLMFLWIVFSFIFLLSGCFHNNLTTIRDGLWFMIAIPIIFFATLPNLMNKSANKLIAIALFLGLLPYIVGSFWLNPIGQSTQLYRGIFSNSNQLGTTSAAISASIFILLIGSISNKNNLLYRIILNLILFCCFIVILIANARTSLIAFSTIFIILFWRLLQKPQYLFGIFFIISMLATVFLNAGEQNTLLLEQISKIQEKESISGRDEIWSQTIRQMQLLGNNSDYFDLNFGLGGHNTIIDILGVNGVIAAFLLVCLAFSSFYYAYLYFQKYAKEDTYAIGPFIITTCFWVISMGESTFGSLGSALTQAYMMSMGVVIHRLNR